MYSVNIFWSGIIALYVAWAVPCRTSDTPVANGFDPDAGHVMPYPYRLSDAGGKTIRLGAGQWQSDAPLPLGFVARKQQNVLLGKAATRQAATDGDLDTPIDVRAPRGKAVFRLDLDGPRHLWRVYVKVGAQAPVSIAIDGRKPLTIRAEQSYQWLPLEVGDEVRTIEMTSSRHFQVFELAALSAPPSIGITIDLGRAREVGSIYLQSQQNLSGIGLATSEGADTWDTVEIEAAGTSSSKALRMTPRTARYWRLYLPVGTKDWTKASLASLRLYDRHGPYGAPPPPSARTPTLRALLGVNGYWGWGANQYSYLQAPGGGPDRYAPVASYARNYHDLTWDITDPDERIDFGRMAERGTPANAWLDWDKEYRRWQRAGLPVQASLQFQRFEPGQWDRPYESAYAYGYAYARHFGPTYGNGLVDRVEVGNEPWHYPAALYRRILDGMSAGLKAGDAALPVVPCALQASDPTAETAFFKNYIGARVEPPVLARLDGLNAHAYSYVPDFFGRSRAVGPAHPLSTFGEVKNMLRWRDANAPGQPVYLSEWGYDYPGPGSDCTHPVCVSADTAVAYALRTLFYGQRLGLKRLTWYYFADEEKPSGLYTRSGLTEERATDFRPKAVFVAFAQLLDRLGDARLFRVVKESAAQVQYELSVDGRTATHLVTWSPVDETSVGAAVGTYAIDRAYAWRNGKLTAVPHPGEPLRFGLQPTIYVLKK